MAGFSHSKLHGTHGFDIHHDQCSLHLDWYFWVICCHQWIGMRMPRIEHDEISIPFHLFLEYTQVSLPVNVFFTGSQIQTLSISSIGVNTSLTLVPSSGSIVLGAFSSLSLVRPRHSSGGGQSTIFSGQQGASGAFNGGDLLCCG